MLSVIVIKSDLVNVFNNNRPNSKQTLILPVHIKSQLSYAAITEKFCIRKLYNLEESQAKEEHQKNANGFTIMAKLSWRSTKLSPGAGILSIFVAPGRDFTKIFCPGAGNLTTWRKFPRGGMLVLGIDWCIRSGEWGLPSTHSSRNPDCFALLQPGCIAFWASVFCFRDLYFVLSTCIMSPCTRLYVLHIYTLFYYPYYALYVYWTSYM